MAFSGLKNILRPALKDSLVWDQYQSLRAARLVKSWRESGEPAPPPDPIKTRIVKSYGSQFGTKTLIETGTYLGDMLHATRRQFTRLISIELSSELCDRAKLRFQKFNHIELLQGDSGDLLPTVLSGITERCLFWLDGHYSGGFTAKASLATPIIGELRTIFAHSVRDHVILIDDARLFNGTEDYPTVKEVIELVQVNRPDFEVSVAHDVI